MPRVRKHPLRWRSPSSSHLSGLRVFATARTLASMESISALPNVELLVLDVTDIDSIKAAKREMIDKNGAKLDILVNNA